VVSINLGDSALYSMMTILLNLLTGPHQRQDADMIGSGSPWVVIGYLWISINIALIVSFNKLDSAQDTLPYELRMHIMSWEVREQVDSIFTRARNIAWYHKASRDKNGSSLLFSYWQRIALHLAFYRTQATSDRIW